MLEEKALVQDTLSGSTVQHIRDMMERAKARKLQLHFLQFLTKYERITFHKDAVQSDSMSEAELITPGHPLLGSTVDLILEKHRSLLKQGAVLIDEADGDETRVLLCLEHAINDMRNDRYNNPLVASRRMQFVEINSEYQIMQSGYAPYHDYRPATDEEMDKIKPILDEAWINSAIEEKAMEYAISELVPQHVDEVQPQRNRRVEKTKEQVRNRLIKEISHWDHRAEELRLEEQAGKRNAKINSQQLRRRVEDLQERLKKREEELERERVLSPQTPVIRGAALIIPAKVIEESSGEEPEEAAESEPEFGGVDKETIERIAMEAVMEKERALGNEPVDVARQNRGWDIESRDRNTGELHLIEVKGRSAAQTTITVTKNEILKALNNPDHFILAVVRVHSATEWKGPFYIKQPFTSEPDWHSTSVNYSLQSLIDMA